MGYVTKEELKTHLREEYADLISRGDETILAAAIDGATAEARGYLEAFDTGAIFTAQGEDRNGLLVIFIKDIAVYHFINLCGAGSYYERREKRYERAVDWLKEVQRGKVTPDLPRKAATADDPSGPFIITSNPKRGQHF